MDRGELAGGLAGLIDAIVEIDRVMTAMSAVKLQLLDQARRHAESSARFVAADVELSRRAFRAEVACALGLSEPSVDRLLSEGFALVEELPATLAAVRDGRISLRHARILIDQTTGLDSEARSELEAKALPLAARLTPRAFDRRLRMLRERRDPEQSVARAERAWARRDVTVEPARDGMAYLVAHLTAVDAVAIHGRLEEAARGARRDGDARGVAQLRADILRELLIRGVTDSELGGRLRGIVPTVVVTVPARTLIGSDQPGSIESYGPIDAGSARALAAEAPTLQRMLTDPETGEGLVLGRARYRVTEDLRRFLRQRDHVCRFPLCGRAARWCDLDHTRDWALDGTSDVGNLAHLCRGHHVLKHATAWRAEQDAGGSGELVWRSPLGRRYVTYPEWPAEPASTRGG